MLVMALTFCQTVLAQESCQEVCFDECLMTENACLNGAWNAYNACSNRCYITYPPWADHGYYGDACDESCNMTLDQAIGSCIFYGDACLDACELIDEDCVCDECPTGFQYNATMDQCVFAVPQGYTLTVENNRIYVNRDCSIPSTDCCPPGFDVAWEQLCMTTTLSEECQDWIDEFLTEAAADEAQGDPIDWDWVNAYVEEIENDPDCQVTAPASTCAYCYSSFLSELNAANYTIQGNMVLYEPYCP